MDKELAECLGLWFAEGDSVTKGEINFCNSELYLVEYFDTILRRFIGDCQVNFRVYCYSKKGGNFKVPFKDAQLNFYSDKLARRPYYIWRVASVKLTTIWRYLFEEVILDEKYYADFLRGFFAGEGSVKLGSHTSRKLTIAQKSRLSFLEYMFDYLGLTYRFWPNQRCYEFTGKKNWNIFYQYGLANLHPLKKQKFEDYYGSYKQEHYSKGVLKKAILKELLSPKTRNELASLFNRSPARIYDVLEELKLESKAVVCHWNNTSYWVVWHFDKIIISRNAGNILLVLKKPLRMHEIAKDLQISYNSARKYLYKLQKLNLVIKRDVLWMKTKKPYHVVS